MFILLTIYGVLLWVYVHDYKKLYAVNQEMMFLYDLAIAYVEYSDVQITDQCCRQ